MRLAGAAGCGAIDAEVDRQPSGPRRAFVSRRDAFELLRDDVGPTFRVLIPEPTGRYDEFHRPIIAQVSPLVRLITRDPSDFALALLDGWATVADVLTFYQERIANEGYLRTATERLSVVELARLIGYVPRPGVAASAYLAYTLEKDSRVTLDIGTRAQSIPGPGEHPQSFETFEKLEAPRNGTSWARAGAGRNRFPTP